MEIQCICLAVKIQYSSPSVTWSPVNRIPW